MHARTTKIALSVATPLVLLAGAGLSGPAIGQEGRITSSSVAISSQVGGRAELEVELADGTRHRITFRDGTVAVDGRTLGAYPEGGALEEAWREFLRRHAGQEADALADALAEWEPEASGEATGTATALREALDGVLGVASPAEPAETVTVTGPEGTQLSIAPGGLSFESLSRSLETLESSLTELGEAAAGADERLALIVHDDYAVGEERTVPGNLALLDGELRLAGGVEGDVLVLDGTLVLEPSGRVTGDILQVGGEVENRGGSIAGELLSIRSVPGREATVEPEAPEAPTVAAEAPRSRRTRVHREPGFLGRIGHNIGHAVGGLAGTISVFIGLAVLGLLAVYFFRSQLETVADTARYSFGRSFAMGLAGEVLFGPALLVMAVLVITWLVIPFFLLGVALALAFGYLAAAHAAGEMFARRRYRYEWLDRLRRSNSYYYVLSGLALLLLPFALEAVLWVFGGLAGFLRGLVMFAAGVATWVAATTGFGAVLLTRAGTQGEARTLWSGRGGTKSAPGEGAGA